jgi:hypothetical protein
MEKVIRYKAKNGRLYETDTEALVDEFSHDIRAQKIAAASVCGSLGLVLSLCQNYEDAISLLRDLEDIAKKTE